MIPETWSKATIGELCQMVKGKAPIMKTKAGAYPLVTMGEEHKTADKYELDTEAVCVPMISSFGHGKPGLKRVHYIKGKFALSNILTALIVREPDKLSTKYLALYLQTFKDQLIVPLQTGAANMSLRPEKLAGVPVHFPSLDEQEHIIQILEEIDSLRQLRAKANQRFNDLIPSVFYEMFGNPSNANNKLDTVELKQICYVKGGKRLPKNASYSSIPTAYRYIRVTDIDEGEVKEEQLRYLSPEVQAQISSYTVSEGDIIISIAGSIGLIAPVGGSLSGANLTENAAKLTPKTHNSYNILYLSHALQSPHAQFQMGLHTGQVTIGKLALFRIEKISIPFPPKHLQDEYANKVNDVRAMKEQFLATSSKFDNLYNTTLARAFAGEL